MIALFNLDQWIPTPQSTPQLQLIGENDMLLRIDIGTTRLERVGTQWRLVDSESLIRQAGDEIVSHWLGARLQLVESAPSPSNQVVAQVWLARQSSPAEVVLYTSDIGDFVQIGDYIYMLQNATFDELVFNRN